MSSLATRRTSRKAERNQSGRTSKATARGRWRRSVFVGTGTGICIHGRGRIITVIFFLEIETAHVLRPRTELTFHLLLYTAFNSTRLSQSDYKLVDPSNGDKVLAVYVKDSFVGGPNLGHIDYFVELGNDLELQTIAAILGIEERLRRNRRRN